MLPLVVNDIAAVSQTWFVRGGLDPNPAQDSVRPLASHTVLRPAPGPQSDTGAIRL